MSAAWGKAVRLLVVAAFLTVAVSVFAGVARAALPDPTAAIATPVTSAAVETTAAQAVAPASTATSPIQPVAETATNAATGTVDTAAQAATASPAVETVTRTVGSAVENAADTVTTTLDSAVAPVAATGTKALAVVADTTAAVTQEPLRSATASLAPQPSANSGSQTNADPSGSRPAVVPPSAAPPGGGGSVPAASHTVRPRTHAARGPVGVDSTQLSAPRFASGVPPTAVSSHEARAARTGGNPRGPLPGGLPPMNGIAAFASGGGGSGALFFGLLGFLLLLAIPTAVRWLRPAGALGLTPAYVAPSDRPG
jgi:hypothetical protein